MFDKRRLIAVLALSFMLVGVLAGCTPTPTPPPPPPPPALVAEEVLLEAAQNLMNNIPDHNFMIMPQQVLDLVEDSPDAVFIIDMRTADEYKAGHIPGAVHINYGQTAQLLDVLPTNKQIIFYCYTGQGSAQTTALTQMLGYNSISFQLGLNFGWKPLGYSEDTLETKENALPAASKPALDERGEIIWDAVVSYFTGSNHIVAPAALHELIDANPDAIMILDTRSPEDYEKGHIEGAVNIPFKQVGQNFDKLPTNRPIYVVCYTGQTAGTTIAALRIAGYNAFTLNRGMIGWNGANLPVVTD